MTPIKIKNVFEKNIKANHPDAKVAWVMKIQRVKYPTGAVMFSGAAVVTKSGYKPRRYHVFADPKTGFWEAN